MVQRISVYRPIRTFICNDTFFLFPTGDKTMDECVLEGLELFARVILTVLNLFGHKSSDAF